MLWIDFFKFWKTDKQNKSMTDNISPYFLASTTIMMTFHLTYLFCIVYQYIYLYLLRQHKYLHLTEWGNRGKKNPVFVVAIKDRGTIWREMIWLCWCPLHSLGNIGCVQRKGTMLRKVFICITLQMLRWKNTTFTAKPALLLRHNMWVHTVQSVAAN